jgi:hypothetical protein
MSLHQDVVSRFVFFAHAWIDSHCIAFDCEERRGRDHRFYRNQSRPYHAATLCKRPASSSNFERTSSARPTPNSHTGIGFSGTMHGKSSGERVQRINRRPALHMALLVLTGSLALLVASAGVYGVTMFVMSRRTQEFGIRMALGATPARIHQLVLRQGFVDVAVGLALGIFATLVVVRLLRGFLDGIDGVFADSGRRFCAVSRISVADKSLPELTCWSVSTGER